MPVLRSIRERFAAERPLDGITVAACLHVTAETANLARALIAGGAEVALCAANPLSTQDDVAAALVSVHGAEVHAVRGEDADRYAAHVAALVAREPQVTLDDGADLRRPDAHGGRVAALARDRGDGGDHDRAGAAALAGGRGPARGSGARGQRGAVRARVQRPLRHRPVHARRHPARHEPAAGGADGRRARLRLDGPRRRRAGARRGRLGDRLRGRSAGRARGADGGLRRAAGAGGRFARRRLHHRHRRPRRAARARTSSA